MLRRTGQTILTLFLASVAVFLVIRLLPGNPALILAGPNASTADVHAISKSLGLSRPLPEQYWIWLTGVLHGNLGTSIINNEPVSNLLGDRLPATLELAGASLCLTLLFGVPAGIVAAIRERTAADHTISVIAAIVLGIPEFWLGIVFILVFAVSFRWLPPGGDAGFSQGIGQFFASLALPALALASSPIMLVIRFVRTATIEALGDDYVRMARAKGASELRVLVRHALRNALIPLLTILGLLVGRLISAAVVIEAVFSWPGVGRLLIDSIQQRDYAVVQAVLLLFVALFLFINFAVDVLYTVVDPRIRLGRIRATA